MIAFLTYSQAPAAHIPKGIPLGLPWRVRYCEEEEGRALQQEGWQLVTEEVYAEYVTSLDAEVAAYEAGKMQTVVEGVVTDAIRFGQELLTSFAAENVLLGVTQDGKTRELLTTLGPILNAVQSGSLYEVIARVREVPTESYDEKYITEARLLLFVNKVERYLGITESTSL